ncbi:GntR family transcriptional regulator [Micromonospora musae]|uniref:GntR family transcriptional regulator n=1 Tax=Micromonospora musae TaxID=1894970 RepID=A0ABX9QTS0_9ACTN|nr:GntR family transcriptional regulator [Micromonospora musae]
MPRYRVIADELRQRIESGVIPPGALLPTESALTAEFRASRGTVRQAIAVLREEGLAVTEHGRGTTARPDVPGQTREQQGEPETRQRKVAADPELAALFGIETGATLISHERVYRHNGVVESVVRSYRLQRPGP